MWPNENGLSFDFDSSDGRGPSELHRTINGKFQMGKIMKNCLICRAPKNAIHRLARKTVFRKNVMLS